MPAGYPKLLPFAHSLTFAPHTPDQGMPVTARKTMKKPTKMPVTAWVSRQKTRFFGVPRTVTTPSVCFRGHQR
ncbi:hypothetical protein D3C78_1546470 [compost metagenome]